MNQNTAFLSCFLDFVVIGTQYPFVHWKSRTSSPDISPTARNCVQPKSVVSARLRISRSSELQPQQVPTRSRRAQLWLNVNTSSKWIYKVNYPFGIATSASLGVSQQDLRRKS